MAKDPNGEKEKEKIKSQGLIDLIFSWSISDVLNKTLLSDKVKKIPQTFESEGHYLKSFIYPLIEEMRADLFSRITTISHARICEICNIKITNGFKLPDSLLYKVTFKKLNEKQNNAIYEPQYKDLIALTDVKPKCIDDLNRPNMPYTLVIIDGKKKKDSNEFDIMSSKAIAFNNKRLKLYAVYLTNLMTNIRIWSALNTSPQVANMNIIRNVLKTDPNAEDDCAICSSDASKEVGLSSRQSISTLGLDKSQELAVLNCLARSQCNHRNTVKLIWGPPGTGKTKTVASLLSVLFEMKCRTLTCAPTNIAVIGVATRLINLVRPSLQFDTYGLGDIVVIGNAERMKIDDHDELFDIFLDYRVSSLALCFSPLSGFKGSLESMIHLLENPEEVYNAYMRTEIDDNAITSALEENMLSSKDPTRNTVLKKAAMKKAILRSLQDNEKELKKKADSVKNKGKVNRKVELKKTILTFEELLIKRFNAIGERLCLCISNLCTHMPTSFIEVGVAKLMIKTINLLLTLGGLFDEFIKENKGLREAMSAFGTETSSRHILNLKRTTEECLQKLKFLSKTISLPNLIEDTDILKFCLKQACLIFCTASSSAKLHKDGMAPIDLVVIDEAAQLKECESTIPLQLHGLRHAVLIGDEKQLPAMVQSKICEKVDFGRSLFERLVILGHQKHLLNVQYRMHPSISMFPNNEFYQCLIEDGSNVKHETYSKQFMGGLMYGSYSFIDVTCGMEQIDHKHSTKNVVEAFAVAEIISKLHKASRASKQKLRVGCISPYKAQVYAIQEKLGNTYRTDADSNFSVDVRSVDGFQGGEEDVIIISTVRCNAVGSVGFLSNNQRTNVGLTRARHCLWILGNSTTLINSGSIWRKLVINAKSRGSFYSINDDNDLVQALGCALIHLNMFDKLLNDDSFLFKSGCWKVCLSKEFPRSLSRIQDNGIQKEAISVIQKLSSGWRPLNKNDIINKLPGTASLLLEMCNVKGVFKLIWMVDIKRENSIDFQVIKILDILPCSKIHELARQFNIIFEDNSMHTTNRCMSKQIEGNVVVPMEWPVEYNNMRQQIGNSRNDNQSRNLAAQLPATSLQDEKRLPKEESRNIVVPMKCPVESDNTRQQIVNPPNDHQSVKLTQLAAMSLQDEKRLPKKKNRNCMINWSYWWIPVGVGVGVGVCMYVYSHLIKQHTRSLAK